jgi:hypothetical protein
VCASPALTSVAKPSSEAVAIGCSALDVPVVPNLPDPYPPQHQATPTVDTAQVCVAPSSADAAMRLGETSDTDTGSVTFVDSLPLPNWPELFIPQHLIVSFTRTAHVEYPPAVMSLASPSSSTSCGSY